MTKKLIIWDWNGTLLNDVNACVDAMNTMLRARQKTEISKDYYKSIFTFPVRNYYETLGFDFSQESFEDLSVEYIDLYNKYSIGARLQEGAIDALQYFKENNYTQIIVSAAEQSLLEQQVGRQEIKHFFDDLLGLGDIYAKSKTENAIKFIQNSGVQYNQVLLIGDTYHDYEVAEAIEAKCILTESGHQNLSLHNLPNHVLIVKNLLQLSNCLVDC